jgi:hypothetical protein
MSEEFHIHIDAKKMDAQLEAILIERYRFEHKNFIQRQGSSPSYAPEIHLTYKTTDLNRSKQIYKDIQVQLEHNPTSMIGYVEYEYVPKQISIKHQDFNSSISIPFHLELDNLPMGTFREDEIHITLDRDNSDPRLLESLSQIGLFSALRQKEYGIAEIFTVQGYSHDIKRILPLLTTYLDRAGGAAKCVVKEEIIVRSWVSSSDYNLPPIIQNIEMHSTPQLTKTI